MPQPFWWLRFKRLIPRLVWVGQEIDVVVTFVEDRLQMQSIDPVKPDDFNKAMTPLFRGALPKISDALREIGVEFDQGLGLSGRDWEWDFSLRGPISVRFKRVCKTTDRRGKLRVS